MVLVPAQEFKQLQEVHYPVLDRALNPEYAIRRVVAEIDIYLSRLTGPGITAVRKGIAKWAKGPVRPQLGRKLPVCDHLDTALQALQISGHVSLAKAIAECSPFLNWVSYDAYPRGEIGADFADNHAFASIIGEGCALEAVDFDLGLFLIAPNLFYRDHHHAAPELYIPLTGPHGWRFNPGDPLICKEAHEPVWNPAWQPHATMTGNIPFFCIFCWTRDIALPAKVIASSDWSNLENPS